MYDSKILKLKELPVFSLADIAQIVSGKEYAKKVIRRMIKEGEIKKLRRNSYTFYDDPFLVSIFLVKPSYISSVSALSYHRLITQIPANVFCFTTKKNLNVGSKIRFFHTDYFFGFEEKEYNGFKIPIATPEKAIIDSIGVIPMSVFEEAVGSIDINKMTGYLKKIKKSSVLKRVGYLLEKNGLNAYESLKNKINSKYIMLDPLAGKRGVKNKKWRLIVNTK